MSFCARMSQLQLINYLSMENFKPSQEGGVQNKEIILPGFDSFANEQIAHFQEENPAPAEDNVLQSQLYKKLLSKFEDSLPEKYGVLYEEQSSLKVGKPSMSNEQYNSELESAANKIISTGLAMPGSKDEYVVVENGELVLYKINSRQESKTEQKFIRYNRPSKKAEPVYEDFTVKVTKIDHAEKVKNLSADDLIDSYGIDVEKAYKFVREAQK